MNATVSKITDKETGISVKLTTLEGSRYQDRPFAAWGWPSRRAKKPRYLGSFSSEAERATAVRGWFERTRQVEATKQEHYAKRREVRQAEQANAERGFEVGDVVYNSWGYEQTNVDFYLIIARTDHYVTLQPIGEKYVETGFMSGRTSPNPDKHTGEPERHKINVWRGKEQSISFKFGAGSKWDGDPVYCSSYA